MELPFRLAIVLIFVFITNASAQLQPQFPISMPSSNAANLGIFSETPVSKFTGIPSISIPMYTVTDGSLSIPIDLNYHAGGVKADIHPGWTGLGWSLKAGGQISRMVKGLEDELDTDLGGFYDNYSILSASDWSSTTKLKAMADQIIDSSPDEFSFSVGDLSGTFMLDDQGSWQVRCDRDVKVIFDPSDFIPPFVNTAPPNTNGISSYHRVFGKFTLIDGKGTKYVFGGTPDAIDFSLDFFSQNSTQWTATSWYLTQVISADTQHSINLAYERDQYTNVLYWNRYQNVYTMQSSGSEVCSSTISSARTAAMLNGNLIAPVYLKSIETAQELIQFDRSTSIESRYSTSIYGSSYAIYDRVRSSSGAAQQQTLQTDEERQSSVDTTLYKFMPYLRQNGITAYPAVLNNLQWKKLDKFTLKDKYTNQLIKQFAFSYSSTEAKRLTLLSLKESNPSASAADTIPSYRFYYDESNPLPVYLSKNVDDWGYATSGASVPDDISLPRKVDPAYTIVGTLRKMIYPTGGYKLFFYEPNDYSATVNSATQSTIQSKNNIGGGLRIKSIFDYDPVSKGLKSSRYFYVKNFTSPSQSIKVSSGIIKNAPTHEWTVNNTLPTGQIFTAIIKSRNSVMPISENADDNPIGYSEVTEVYQDNSYIINKYTNYDDGHLDEGVINSLFPEKVMMNDFTSLSLERGKLKFSAVYNSSGIKLKSTTMIYQPLRNNRTFVRLTDKTRYQVCDYGVAGATLSGPYVYEGGAFKFYTYPYVPTSVTDSLFDGANPVVKTSNFYYDNPLNKLLTRTEAIRTDGSKMTEINLFPQDYASGTAFIDQMISKNINESPIETVRYLTNPSDGSTKIVSGSIQTYDAANPLLKDADYRMESIVPVALPGFKFSGSATGLLPYAATKSTFSKDALYRSTNTYSYDSYSNLKQSNVIGGTSSSFLWGYNNSLPIARATNAQATEIYYNGFEEELSGTSADSRVGQKSKSLGGATFVLPTLASLTAGRKYIVSFWYKNSGGNWTFSSTAYTTVPTSIGGYELIDELRIYPEGAKMTTSSFYSLRGQPSGELDAAGRSISYEYDALQRLRTVRDQNKNILKQFSYNYAPITPAAETFYFSALKTASYQKNNCSDGKTGTFVTYVVGAGSYASSISQFDADNLAQAELTAQGQANANALGTCNFLSAAKTGTFLRSNCTGVSLPVPYVVNVPLGYFTSEVSQSDADTKAQDYLNTQGALVNGSGSCYIPVVSVSAVNGQNTTSSLKVTLTNTGTGAVYVSAIANKNETKVFSVPPGTYSVTINTTGVVGSVRLIRNGNFQACNPGSWGTLTLGSTGNEQLTFNLTSGACPPPL